jgi:hypothetical protein
MIRVEVHVILIVIAQRRADNLRRRECSGKDMLLPYFPKGSANFQVVGSKSGMDKPCSRNSNFNGALLALAKPMRSQSALDLTF